MPTYDFLCEPCGTFEKRLSIAQRDEPQRCPRCDGPARRVWTTPPMTAQLSAGARLAHGVNERSQHEPSVGSGVSTLERSKAAKRPTRGGRPWMIGH
ncbi:FmdB family zinc ribbon protein [Deinococcus sp.]|uniref:FmdB family zinc ribbon protein n=1 Tax=Deinococcus sp. TaxID=47478 RepID=UPI0034C68989